MSEKCVLISIRPQWCELIASGKKTLEVRKSRPKLDTPFKCYIYETKGKTDTPWVDEDGHLDFHGRGQVIGEFVCDYINRVAITGMFDDSGNQIDNGGQLLLRSSCLTSQQFADYLDAENGYGWHISALKIYDKPRELSEFSRLGFKKMGNSEIVCCNFDCPHSDGWPDYDEPPSCDIEGCCLQRPPQSWCYVEATEC